MRRELLRWPFTAIAIAHNDRAAVHLQRAGEFADSLVGGERRFLLEYGVKHDIPVLLSMSYG